MRPAIDALDGTTLAQLPLFMSKVLRKEHRAPFALRLRHSVRMLFQDHDIIVEASDASTRPPALALNMEWATSSLTSIWPCWRNQMVNAIGRAGITSLPEANRGAWWRGWWPTLTDIGPS